MKRFDPNAPTQPGSGIFGLPCAPEEAALVLVPAPWEATVSYGSGTSAGPEAIRSASGQIDLFDLDFGRAHEASIAMLDRPPLVVRWNREARARAREVIARSGRIAGSPDLERALARVNTLSGKFDDWVEETVSRWLEKSKRVGLVGGDHSVSLGAIAAQARRGVPFDILHLDAHADLRRAYEGFSCSHASIMDNVLTRFPEVERVVQVGVRDLCDEEFERIETSNGRVVWFPDSRLKERQFRGEPWNRQVDGILEGLGNRVYLSFDIDGLDPSLCPNTGTPVPGGLSFAEVSYLLVRLVRSGRKIVGFDLVEVAPAPDGNEWDASVGARLLYKMCLATLESGGERTR